MIHWNLRASAVLFAALLLTACGRNAETTEPGETPVAAEPAPTADAPAEPATDAPAEPATDAPAEPAAAPTGSSVSEADLGVPFYQGAEVITSNVMKTNEFTTHMVQLKSSDTIQQLHDFYKAELGDNLTMDHVGTSGGKPNAALIKVDGNIQYSIAITEQDGATVATISKVDRSGAGG